MTECHETDPAQASPLSGLSTIVNILQHHGRPSFPSLSGSLTSIDRDFEGSLMADNLALPYNRRKSLVVHYRSIISQRLAG
jgi:hypothetical protein